MAQSKKTSGLAAALRQTRDVEPLDIVVELHPSETASSVDAKTRAERLAAKQHHFELGARAVIDTIRNSGGEVQASGWMNDTVYARVDRTALDALEGLAEVKTLDVPGEVTFHS